MIATPIGRREISSAIAVVRPSTLAMIAFRSFGFVTFRMIWVLHWLSTFLSTFAARCVITTSPRPNLRPSEASVRKIFEEATWPTWGQKLCDSSTTSIIGGIRPTFRSSNMAVARRFTTSSWMSGGTPFKLMIVVLPLRTSSSIRVPSFAKIFELVDQGRVLRIVLPLEDADDVSDRVVFRGLSEQVERLAQGGQVDADPRGARQGQDITGIEVAQRKLQGTTAGVDLRVRGEDLDGVSVSPGIHVKASGSFRVLALLAERGVLPVRVEDHARHVVLHQFLDQHARDV